MQHSESYVKQRDLLRKGCKALGLGVSTHQQAQLLDYIQLLEHWNKAFNLTAIREPLTMVSHHLLDSLTVLPHVNGKTVLDIGSGAGLPGIPLAIMLPERRFTLLDSNGKKTRFLKQAVQKLNLSKVVEVIKIRIEEYRPTQPFDTVISRAFSSLDKFLSLSQWASDQGSLLLAMKGRRPDDELKTLDSTVKLIAVTTLSVPGLTAERHLISLQRTPK